MRIVKGIVIGLLLLAALLLAIGFMLPRHGHVERSIVINAPQAEVFDTVNSIRRFNEFSPWVGTGPTVQYTYEGPDHGVGAKMSWPRMGGDGGTDSNEIVESSAPGGVRMRISSENTADVAFVLEPVDGGTRVTWTFDIDFGNNLIWRSYGLMLDEIVGPDYEKGLTKLKQVMESGNAG